MRRHNGTKHDGTSAGGHTQQTPKPTTAGHKEDGAYFSPLAPLFYAGRAAPAFLPACRARSCLYRAFPHRRRYNNTRPHPPEWPCHAARRQTPPQTGPQHRAAPHAGTLTLTPDFPRLTITLGGRGAAFRDHLGHDDSAASTTPPAPFYYLTARASDSSAGSSWAEKKNQITKQNKLDPLDYFLFLFFFFCLGALIVKQSDADFP